MAARRVWCGGAVLLAFLGLAWGVASSQPVSVQEGQKLFQQNCSACHTLGGGKLVGPDLAGVTARREREWLARFIKDPSQLFAAEDPIATQLLKEYGVPMPKLGLTAQQIEALIAYLQTTESPTAPTALPALYLPTLIAAVIAVVALTALGLTMGRKRVEVRP